MSYSKYYNPTNWENYPSEDTAINAMHLNNLEDGVDTLDDRIVALSTDKSEVSWNQTLISGEKIAEITVNGITKDVYAPEISDSVVEQAAEQALKSEGYAVGTQGDVPVTSGLYYHNNSKYYSEQASDSASDASASAVEAGQSADDAEEEALVSEGWANGEQNGEPVPSTSPYYENNAKYYAENASDFVKSGVKIKTDTTGQFETSTGGVLQSCNVDLDPVQDLHGYSKPWVSGGKNLIPMTVANLKALNTTGTWSGNTYTFQNGAVIDVLTDDDGNVIGFKGSGTTTASTSYNFNLCEFNFVSGTTYKLNGITGGSNQTYRINIAGVSNYSNGDNTVNGDGSTHAIRIQMQASYSPLNFTITPMLRLATETDATFEPYTNICSISGHTSVEVDVTDADSNTTQYTISLGQTVYGGSLDIVSGSGSDEWANIASYNGETITEPWLSSMDEYVSGTTPTTGAQVVYKKATATSFSTTPTQIETLIGENNVSMPLSGQSLDSLTYRAIMAWSDIENAFDTDLSVTGTSIYFTKGGVTTGNSLIDTSRAKVECLAYINTPEGMVVPDMAYKTGGFATGEHFMNKGKFCTAIANIAEFAPLEKNTNYVEGTIADALASLSARITALGG